MLTEPGCADADSLCEDFWQGDADASPLRRFLDDARELFPAFPSPMLRLLSALASGEAAVTAALQYLDSIPGLTCRHSTQEDSLQLLDQSLAEATEALPVQGTGLFIPQACSLSDSIKCCPYKKQVDSIL